LTQEADVTALLAEVAKGNPFAEEKLAPLIYGQLKQLARRHMRRERAHHTLQTTALVHEAYLKLVHQQSPNWRGRAQFFGIAAQLMRRILVDHARHHLREKRGGGQMVLPLSDALALSQEHSEDLLKVDEALDRLAKLDPRQSQIVELRFFGGLSVEETSKFLGVSPITVKRDWALAKVWLYGELRPDNGHDTKTVATR
jgi:RNA polymerase sigma-70 factor, ECF subfamily